jgi:amidase
MPTIAFPHDQEPRLERLLKIDGEEVWYDNQIAWAGTLNGFPVTTVPIGDDPGGLPIGTQIIGAYLGDNTTIRFAELGGSTAPPKL